MNGNEAANSKSELVRDGWNSPSQRFHPDQAVSDAFGHSTAEHRAWLLPIFRDLPRGAPVLDLGCGCGIPDARLLSAQFEVTGVDVSDVQVERARKLVPSARFIRADMTEVEFPEASFGAAISLYSLIHVPVDRHPGFLRRVRTWLAPHACFVLIAGHEAFTGVEDDWLGSGAPMYWSHASAEDYRRWLAEAGFEVADQTFVPEGRTGHEMFLARATGPPGSLR